MKLDLGRALLSTLDALNGLGIRYAIVGGLAVGAWGMLPGFVKIMWLPC